MSVAAAARTGGSYSFAAEPRPVRDRPKYRDPFAARTDESGASVNIMYDRRIVRGNTYAATVLRTQTASTRELSDLQRDTQRARQRQREKSKPVQRSRTPEAVDGRKHMEIQTEEYLEEITDRVPEFEMGVQTDPFEDRPSTPLYVPQKSGVDAETQILEGELFDFDVEVEPLLDVIVGKTIEQSLLEVMEEEEIAAMQAHQRDFEQRRNAELAETQRLEAAEKRSFEEKERRKQQERERLLREKKTKEKLAARKHAKDVLADLEGSVLRQLTDAGFFYDRVEREVETGFLPALMEKVHTTLDQRRADAEAADAVIRAAIGKALALAASARAERERCRLEREREEAERAEREAREREERRLKRERALQERMRQEQAADGEGEAEHEPEDDAEAEEGEEDDM